jgi:hypothetical protein
MSLRRMSMCSIAVRRDAVDRHRLVGGGGRLIYRISEQRLLRAIDSVESLRVGAADPRRRRSATQRLVLDHSVSGVA